MYTQCSRCDTVFELSADVLRTAGGQVRCGNCGEVFNALARLAEDSSAFAAEETPIDWETRADHILESSAAGNTPQPQPPEDMDGLHEEAQPGVEIASLEVIDWPEDESVEEPPEKAPPAATREEPRDEPIDAAPQTDDDRSLEFTLPPGELDRIFIESKKPPALDVSVLEAPPADGEAYSPAVPRRVTGFEVPEDVRRDMLSGVRQPIVPASVAPGALAAIGRTFQSWLIAAVVSALLLTGQIVHHNREWIAAHADAPLGTAVRGLYGAMGSALPERANLSAYQLRQWGVTGDPEANGILRLRASILNAAPQPQPWPVLRVTLADRFGKSIGRRDFQPGEYMGKPTAALLASGERADATFDILDPGKNAEGFEIDVCARAAEQRISCAGDATPQVER